MGIWDHRCLSAELHKLRSGSNMCPHQFTFILAALCLDLIRNHNAPGMLEEASGFEHTLMICLGVCIETGISVLELG